MLMQATFHLTQKANPRILYSPLQIITHAKLQTKDNKHLEPLAAL